MLVFDSQKKGFRKTRNVYLDSNRRDKIIEKVNSGFVYTNIKEREVDYYIPIIMEKFPGISKNVANTINRKFIIQSMHITRDNLSRYIKRFKEQGLLVQGKVEDELFVNKMLIPEIIGDRVQITIILKLNK